MVASDMIKGKIKESGMTQKIIAREMGLAQGTLSQKINNERPLFLDEACRLAEILGIKNEFFTYFFAQKVAQCNKPEGQAN